MKVLVRTYFYLMNYINFSGSPISLLDFVRYVLQNSGDSFSFYSGKLAYKDQEFFGDGSQISELCEYTCKRIREEWSVNNIGIMTEEDGELLMCVTSPDPSMPAEVIGVLVESLAVCIAYLSGVKWNSSSSDAESDPGSSDSESDDSLDKDISSTLIQVNATKNEISERINRFIGYKREQANINNILDFCGPPDIDKLCARVDAVLTRKKNSSSHMAVRNVLDRFTHKHTAGKTKKLETSDSFQAGSERSEPSTSSNFADEESLESSDLDESDVTEKSPSPVKKRKKNKVRS
uniref:Uncharacterized protein n=1 Tax=Homalodisca liturata TaxID=320908 RepID=A0A1B6HCL6_9HEMI